MGYFSECAIDYAKAASYERVDYSYPTKQETLNYYLEDLTSALEKLDEERPHDPLHPEYDRYFYSTGKYRVVGRTGYGTRSPCGHCGSTGAY